METFRIVKREDEKLHGEYRTKRMILEIYDEMRRAMEKGVPYETRLVRGRPRTEIPVKLGHRGNG